MHADIEAKLATGGFTMCYLVSIAFDTPMHVTTAPHSVNSGGVVYAASHNLTSVPDAVDTADIRVGSFKLVFSGVSQEFIALLLLRSYIGRSVVVQRAVLDEQGRVVGAAMSHYAGTFSDWSINDSTTQSAVTITAASHWAAWDKVAGRKTNSDSQAAHYPLDQFFSHSAQAVREIKWGRP